MIVKTNEEAVAHCSSGKVFIGQSRSTYGIYIIMENYPHQTFFLILVFEFPSN